MTLNCYVASSNDQSVSKAVVPCSQSS